MAPSPAYLALLDQIAPDESQENVLTYPHIALQSIMDAWQSLRSAWRVRGEDTRGVLQHLAESAICFVAATRVEQNYSQNWNPYHTVYDVLYELQALHEAKNAGYAGADNPDPWANFRECETFGIPATDGVITRMSDKLSRLCRLTESASNERVGESIEDTAKDLAAYALILVCLLDEQTRRRAA